MVGYRGIMKARLLYVDAVGGDDHNGKRHRCSKYRLGWSDGF